MENEPIQKPRAKSSRVISMLSAMFLYYIGYRNITAPRVENGTTLETIAPYLGYGCIIIASVSAIAIIYSTFKEVKTKKE